MESYYRHVVKGFSSIAALFTKMTQKGDPFKWSDECEKSYQKLKVALTISPVLVLPRRLGPYTIYYDALCIRLGAVLIQDSRMIAYAFHQLKIH